MKHCLALAFLLLAIPEAFAATPPSCMFVGYFDINSAVLSEKFERALHEVYGKGSYCFENFGETGNFAFRGIVIRGSAGESDALDHTTLARARAKAVGDYLVSLGLPPRAMKLVADGTARPVAQKASSPLEGEQNRHARIMFTFDPL